MSTFSFGELLSTFRAFLESVAAEPLPDFLAGIDWNMPARRLAPLGLSCLRHLERCAEIAGKDARALAQLLASHGSELRWGQTYTAEDFGQRFLDNYGWLEVFGTRGHFVNDGVAGGFLMLGPGVTYPDHHHVAAEIYVPLTGGTEWRMGEGAFRRREAGEVIHHRSDVGHAMRTGEEPLLALYLWRGGPLDQRSTIGRSG